MEPRRTTIHLTPALERVAARASDGDLIGGLTAHLDRMSAAYDAMCRAALPQLHLREWNALRSPSPNP